MRHEIVDVKIDNMNLLKRTNMNKEQVEKARFCPLTFACTGGAGPSAETTGIKALCAKIGDLH